MTTVETGTMDPGEAYAYDGHTWGVDQPPAPGFQAPKFQANYTHGTYVAGRHPSFKVHESKGHAKRALTMSNTRVWQGAANALTDCAIYEKTGDGWLPIESYQAGAELPWRTRSTQ